MAWREGRWRKESGMSICWSLSLAVAVLWHTRIHSSSAERIQYSQTQEASNCYQLDRESASSSNRYKYLLQSHSCPRCICRAILLAHTLLLLGFLFPVCFSPRYVSRFDFERQFPQGLLSQMVAEVIEECDYIVISLDVVMSIKPERTLQLTLQLVYPENHPLIRAIPDYLVWNTFYVPILEIYTTGPSAWRYQYIGGGEANVVLIFYEGKEQ